MYDTQYLFARREGVPLDLSNNPFREAFYATDCFQLELALVKFNLHKIKVLFHVTALLEFTQILGILRSDKYTQGRIFTIRLA